MKKSEGPWRPTSEYAKAGVDIAASDLAKARIKGLIEKTFNDSVVGSYGGFGGLYSLKKLTGCDKILVGSADGVGTKLKLACMTGRHDTVGQDLVNHLVNDILCCGAKPLFFFDYLGLGKVAPGIVEDIVKGIAIACRENDTALLGGETAELPGIYSSGEYDLAGFIVGWVDSDKIIDGKRIKPGDKIIGLASTGLHTNGYSLARRAFFEIAGLHPGDTIEETGTEICRELLTVHRSYSAVISPLLDEGLVHGLAHITGGGFEGNVKRILPESVAAVINTAAWGPPGVFKAIARIASVADEEMYRVFNMGVGMVLICDAADSQEIIKQLRGQNAEAFEIGVCRAGNGEVTVNFER